MFKIVSLPSKRRVHPSSRKLPAVTKKALREDLLSNPVFDATKIIHMNDIFQPEKGSLDQFLASIFSKPEHPASTSSNDADFIPIYLKTLVKTANTHFNTDQKNTFVTFFTDLKEEHFRSEVQEIFKPITLNLTFFGNKIEIKGLPKSKESKNTPEDATSLLED